MVPRKMVPEKWSPREMVAEKNGPPEKMVPGKNGPQKNGSRKIGLRKNFLQKLFSVKRMLGKFNFPGNLNTWPNTSLKRFFLLPFLQPKKNVQKSTRSNSVTDF